MNTKTALGALIIATALLILPLAQLAAASTLVPMVGDGSDWGDTTGNNECDNDASTYDSFTANLSSAGNNITYCKTSGSVNYHIKGVAFKIDSGPAYYFEISCVAGGSSGSYQRFPASGNYSGGLRDSGILPLDNTWTSCNRVKFQWFWAGGGGSYTHKFYKTWSYTDISGSTSSGPASPTPGTAFRWTEVRAGVYDTTSHVLGDLYLQASGVTLCNVTMRHEDVDLPNQYAEVTPPTGTQLGDDYGLTHYTNITLGDGTGYYILTCEAAASGLVIAARVFIGAQVASGTPAPTPTAPPPGTISGGYEVCGGLDLNCLVRNIGSAFSNALAFVFVPSDATIDRVTDIKDDLMDHEPMYFISLAFSYAQPLVQFFWDFYEDADTTTPSSWCYENTMVLARGAEWIDTEHTAIHMPTVTPTIAFCVVPGEAVGDYEGSSESYYHANIRPLLGYAVYLMATILGLRRFTPYLHIGA